jgi:hypothetical protein
MELMVKTRKSGVSEFQMRILQSVFSFLVWVLFNVTKTVVLAILFAPFMIWHNWKHPEDWAKHREEQEARKSFRFHL